MEEHFKQHSNYVEFYLHTVTSGFPNPPNDLNPPNFSDFLNPP